MSDNNVFVIHRSMLDSLCICQCHDKTAEIVALVEGVLMTHLQNRVSPMMGEHDPLQAFGLDLLTKIKEAEQ